MFKEESETVVFQRQEVTVSTRKSEEEITQWTEVSHEKGTLYGITFQMF